MSAMPSEINNKENIPLSEGTYSANSDYTRFKKQQDDIIRLEKLYSEQVLKTQAAHSEQERLEVEILEKEKVILQQITSLKKLGDLNKSLSTKLSEEVSYYESELENHKKSEREWQSKINRLQVENERIKRQLELKNEEINGLNQEIEKFMSDLDAKTSEVDKLNYLLNGQQNILEDSDEEDGSLVIHAGDLTFDDSFNDEDSLGQLLIEEEDEETAEEDHYNTTDNSLSLAGELNNKLDEREKVVKKFEFEINALKHEKEQLYNYINKLLRNPNQPNQNDVLKQKLVSRKILRATSVSMNVNKKSEAPHKHGFSKRVVSNYLDLKSYSTSSRSEKTSKPYHLNNNSDDETSLDEIEHNELEYERWLLGYSGFGHRILGIAMKLKPTNVLLPDIDDEDDDSDWEDILEEDVE